MLRYRGESGEQRQGFKPGVSIVAQAAGHRIPHRDMVGDKDSVQGRRFGLTRQAGVIVEGKYVRFRRVRVAPGETVIPLWVIKEEVQDHVSVRHSIDSRLNAIRGGVTVSVGIGWH